MWMGSEVNYYIDKYPIESNPKTMHLLLTTSGYWALKMQVVHMKMCSKFKIHIWFCRLSKKGEKEERAGRREGGKKIGRKLQLSGCRLLAKPTSVGFVSLTPNNIIHTCALSSSGEAQIKQNSTLRHKPKIV